MAFVAGIILMYLPEEPAFRMLVALLAERGPDLRRMYKPGLDGLKAELRKFEWLLQRSHPALARHLVVRPRPAPLCPLQSRPASALTRRLTNTGPIAFIPASLVPRCAEQRDPPSGCTACLCTAPQCR